MILELLAKYGYLFHRSCRCSGIYTEKWKCGPYTVEWRKTRYRIAIKFNRDMITPWFVADQLETHLKKIHEVDQTVVLPPS